MKFLDYSKAISIGARTLGILKSTYTVFLSRFYYGFGPSLYSLFRFYKVPPSQWCSYIRGVDAYKLLKVVNGGKENTVLTGNKIRFFRHCNKNDIRTVPILGTLGKSSEDSIRLVSSPMEFERLMSTAPPQVFFKTSNGAHGDGAFVAFRSEGNVWLVKGESYRIEELYKLALSWLSEGSSYLIQSLVKPHEGLLSIMPGGALGTVRIMTYLDGDEARAFLPVLRIPANGNVTDNFSLGLLGNLVAPIDLYSGEVGIAKFSKRRDWPDIIDTIIHPDTGELIAGKMLPFWNETVELVLDAQRKTRQLPTLGWDVAITDDGPLIVEANTLYAVELIEVAHGRGIRDELEPVIALYKNKLNDKAETLNL